MGSVVVPVITGCINALRYNKESGAVSGTKVKILENRHESQLSLKN